MVELLKSAVDGRGAAVSPSVSFTYRERSENQRSEVAVDGVAKVTHVVDHLYVAALAEALHALLRIGLDPLVAVGAPELGSLVDDVVAAVGVLAQSLGKVVLIRMGLGVLVVLVGDQRRRRSAIKILMSLIDVHALLGDDVGKLPYSAC